MNKALFFGMALLILPLAGCDNIAGDDGSTYYYQTGIVSKGAYYLISVNVGIAAQSGLPAQQAFGYCNQHPVYGKGTAQSGYTRLQLERVLEQITVMDFSARTEFLRKLDSGGAVFQMFTLEDEDVVYYYAKKEESEG